MSVLPELFRPVGQKEMDLIAASGFREFPPRLAWQPIFYPVLSIDYAIEIARDWNAEDRENGAVGYVTRFEIDSDYVARFPKKCVGGSKYIELWVPAEELTDFNRRIVGEISVVREYRDSPAGN